MTTASIQFPTSSLFLQKEDLSAIPGNRGWIVNGHKIAGKATDVPEENAKFVQRTCGTNQDMLHTFNPRGFVLTEMEKAETDGEGWTTIRRRKLVTCHSKKPCQREIDGNGYCDLCNDEEHRKFHYHFSRKNQKGDGERLPICKYSKQRCWEINRDPRHKHRFFHYDDDCKRSIEPYVPTDDDIDRELDRWDYLH